MRKPSSLALPILALLVWSHSTWAQSPRIPPSVAQGTGMGNVPVTSGDSVQQQQAKAASQQRQAEIRRDTEKMFQLTAELKHSLETSGQDVLSADDLKKAEQIEKLAHSVKSKMKQSF